MLLTVDIGNTNITLGVFEGKKLTYHISNDNNSDTYLRLRYGMVMCELLEQ